MATSRPTTSSSQAVRDFRQLGENGDQMSIQGEPWALDKVLDLKSVPDVPTSAGKERSSIQSTRLFHKTRLGYVSWALYRVEQSNRN
jgi:hypothetical protein